MTTNAEMKGLYTALITPFDNAGNLCLKTLETLLYRQEQAQVDAVVLLGTTGEPATVEDFERDQLIAHAVKQLKGKVPIMVGCGSPSTKKAVELAKRAADLGADSIQVITPYLNKPTQEGLFLHYEAISSAVKLPICVYNIPGRCNVNIEVATLQRIAQLPNIFGVKECSGSFQQSTDIIEKICHKKPGFSLICGDDPVTIPMMAIGAHGVMSVISNLIPRTMVQLVQAMQSGNVAQARSIHYAIKPLLQAVSLESNPIAIKHLMHLANLDSGYLRLPLTKASSATQNQLAIAFEACKKTLEQEATIEALV